jgi:hypothetical protein
MDGRALRSGILRFLATTQGSPWAVSNLAVVLQEDERLVAGVLDLLEEEGVVRRLRVMGPTQGEVVITSRGYVEAQALDDGGSEESDAPKPAVKGETSLIETRHRLQKQLDEVEELIQRGAAATLDEMKRWVYWTLTVLRRVFGDNSEKVAHFVGVTRSGGWPYGYEGAEADGYRDRLPEWHRLLQTWLREIDEFETPSGVAERYIPPRSQFDAYVLLKDMMETAAASLTVVDPYTGDATLQMLKAVGPDVHVRILTVKPDKGFDHVLTLFRQQWGENIEVRQGPKELHDRFLLLDDKVFFSGASFKHLGQKGSFIAEIRTDAIKDAVRKDIEAWWEAAQPIT